MLQLGLLLTCVALVAGHGRLIQPASRSSAWRFGFGTPRNLNDNELFCGGFDYQQSVGGKCGICGDPWGGPRENEAGGYYATGTITGKYEEGEVISIGVELTANHLGWFEFRICPNNDIKTPATPECLDQHLLPLADGSGTRYQITSDMYGRMYLDVRLPEGLVCETQCVVQWKYHTGNRWGTDPETGESGIGFGPQEEFYGCSDVTIMPHGVTAHPTVSTHKPPSWSTTPPPTTPKGCVFKATGEFEGDPDMDAWCQKNCPVGHCPPDLCVCVVE